MDGILYPINHDMRKRLMNLAQESGAKLLHEELLALTPMVFSNNGPGKEIQPTRRVAARDSAKLDVVNRLGTAPNGDKPYQGKVWPNPVAQKRLMDATLPIKPYRGRGA